MPLVRIIHVYKEYVVGVAYKKYCFGGGWIATRDILHLFAQYAYQFKYPGALNWYMHYEQTNVRYLEFPVRVVKSCKIM